MNRALSCRSIASAVVVTALFAMATAHAADPAPVRTPSFSQFDANRDGLIDSREASPSLEVSGWMTSADSNKDGKLSEAEFVEIQTSLGILRK